MRRIGRMAMIICLVTALPPVARADPTFGLGGEGRDGARTATAAGRTIYVAGIYQGEVDFDPGADVVTRTAGGDHDDPRSGKGALDGFIARYTTQGELLGVITLGGRDVQFPSGIRVGPGGDFFVVGMFAGTTDFEDTDPEDEVDTRTAEIGRDGFVARYHEDGALAWVHAFGDDDVARGGSGRADLELSEACTDVAVAPDGSSVVVGMFCGRIDLDPGADVVSRTSRDGSRDIFVVALDPAGAYRWGTTIGGGGMDQGHAAAFGPGGAVHVAGFFSETVDFDPSADEEVAIAAGGSDAFVASFGPDGTFQRVLTWGGRGSDQVRRCCLAVDRKNRIVVGGDFSEKADFEPSRRATERRSAGGLDAYLARFTPRGRLDWVATWGAGGSDAVHALDVQADGEIVVTGRYQGDVILDPRRRRLSLHSRTNAESSDAFVARFTTKGKPRWIHALGVGPYEGRHLTSGDGVAFLPQGAVVVVGNYKGALFVGPGKDAPPLESNGNTDVFVVTYDADGVVQR